MQGEPPAAPPPRPWLLAFNDNGIPLLSLAANGREAPPFAVSGLVAALHSSARDGGFRMVRLATASNACCTLQSFAGGLHLALSAPAEAAPGAAARRLELAYSCMVMHAGAAELAAGPSGHVRRVQRQLRAAAGALRLVLAPPVDGSLAAPLSLGLPARVLPGAYAARRLVRAVAVRCRTAHVALYSRHRLVESTSEWRRDLAPGDLAALCLLLASLPPAASRDVPVYLRGSALGGGGGGGGSTPYRLVTVALHAELDLVLLCGPSPPAREVAAAATEALRASGARLERLRAAAASGGRKARAAVPRGPEAVPLRRRVSDLRAGLARGVPPDFAADPAVLAFIAVDGGSAAASCAHPSPGGGPPDAAGGDRLTRLAEFAETAAGAAGEAYSRRDGYGCYAARGEGGAAVYCMLGGRVPFSSYAGVARALLRQVRGLAAAGEEPSAEEEDAEAAEEAEREARGERARVSAELGVGDRGAAAAVGGAAVSFEPP